MGFPPFRTDKLALMQTAYINRTLGVPVLGGFHFATANGNPKQAEWVNLVWGGFVPTAVATEMNCRQKRETDAVPAPPVCKISC